MNLFIKIKDNYIRKSSILSIDCYNANSIVDIQDQWTLCVNAQHCVYTEDFGDQKEVCLKRQNELLTLIEMS